MTYKAMKNVWRESKQFNVYPGDTLIFTLKFDILGINRFGKLRLKKEEYEPTN